MEQTTAKICVPLVSETREALLKEAELAAAAPSDLVEWRADFSQETDYGAIAVQIAKVLGSKPLLITFRTMAQGGRFPEDPQKYMEAAVAVLSTEACQYFDIETSIDDEIYEAVASLAHRHGVKVIRSYHDFKRTPKTEGILSILNSLMKQKPEYIKAAFMPKDREDVLRLMMATSMFKKKNPDQKVITMSMGEIGKISRISGFLFGSEVTFGMVQGKSAPGQIPVDKLRYAMEVLI